MQGRKWWRLNDTNGHQQEDLLHPLGEDTESVDSNTAQQEMVTFGGMIQVRREEDAGVSAHITGIRGDDVLPQLSGIQYFHSEDSVRWGLLDAG